MKTTKKPFDVWVHFRSVGTEVVACNHCDKIMSMRKSTSNLERHIERIHSLPDLESVDKEEEEEVKEEETVVMEIPYNSGIKTQSVEESCRICLCDLVQIDHVGLRDSVKKFKDVTYLDIFKQCTGFDVNEQEPQHLCVDCMLKLVEAFELRQQCRETQQVLEDLFSATYKEEEMVIEQLVEDSPQVFQEDEEIYEEVMEIRIETPTVLKKSVEKIAKNVSINSDPVSQQLQEIQCETCLSNYKSIRALRNHYNLNHPDLKTNECEFCQKKFFPQLIDIHKGHCSQRHNHIQQLCPICGQAASRNHIYRHLARAKAIDETGRVIDKPYECDICGARATTKNGIAIHIKALHLQLKIKCDFCDVQVKSRSILGTHMRRYHPEIKKPLSCDYCEFQTTSAASLVRHKATHFGNRPHKCDFCARSFVTKDAWRVHIATHSDDRPHKCEICDAAFKTRKALGAHMKTHKAHEYECFVCKKSYLTNQQMRLHVTRVHPDFPLPPRGTILNKSWHAKRTELEMKVEAARAAFSGEYIDSIEVATDSIKEEIYY